MDFLKETAGIPKTVCCRYNPGGVFELGNGIMDNPGDAKYGMSEDQMAEAYTRLMKLGAEEFGIHSFLASNTVTDDYYPKLAGILFELAVRLHKRTGARIKFINLSGGVGIAYRPDQRSNDIAAIGEGVRKKFEEILVPAGMGDVAIFTEMGRFMLAPYGYNYNGKLRSAEVLLKPDGSFQKIRRAETPADYFATFDFTPFFKK